MDGQDVHVLFEDLMEILRDDDWHRVDETADKLSLSDESLLDILKNLEKAGVIESSGLRKGTSLFRGTGFIDTFFDLPYEEDFNK